MDRFKKGPAGPPKRPTPLPPKRPTPGMPAGPGVGRQGPGGSSTPAADQTREQINRLQSRLSDVQPTLALTSINNDMAEIENGLALLPTQIEELRTRGYVFRSFLERKCGVLTEQWRTLRERVSREAGQRRRELEIEANSVSSALRLATGGSTSQIARADSAISTLESKANAAQSSLRALYQPLNENLHQTRRQVEQISWLLDQLSEASFQLHPAEDPLVACEAQYMETEKDGPKGVLFLTDERLIFERKEEVATKKVLFITTEKQKVQELAFELPIGLVEVAQASDKGVFGRKEMLQLTFAPQADLSGATLRLFNVDNEEWAALIGRVKSGEIAAERTKSEDEAVVEAARAVPTKCLTCGATLSAEVVRGMREITCEYCGSVVRL